MSLLKSQYLISLNSDANEIYAYKKESGRLGSVEKNEDLVILRDWCPVFHSGYYAIVGFNESTNGLIMSEPIINVQRSHRIFESPRKYYQIKGNYSLLTFSIFHESFNENFNNDIAIMMDDFKNGLPVDWIQSINQLHMVVTLVSDMFEKPFLQKKINDSFKEITNPVENYYLCDISDKKRIKYCFDDVFTMIKNNENWRSVISEELKSSGHKNVIGKLKKEKRRKQHLTDEGRSSSEYKSLFMWYPEKDSITQTYYITGYLLNKDKELEEFRSKIVYVHRTGVHVVTDNQPVRLLGPICTIKIEETPNVFIMNSLLERFIRGLCYGLPPYWKDIVTVIDVAMSMEFDNPVIIDVVGDGSSDKEN